MRYIWQPRVKPDNRQRMHIQAMAADGSPYNGALCGMSFHGGYRTINAPFALGRKICKHCRAAQEGNRRLPGWLN